MLKSERDPKKDKIILDAYLEEVYDTDQREAVKLRAVRNLIDKLHITDQEANKYFEDVLKEGFPISEQKNINVIDRAKK